MPRPRTKGRAQVEKKAQRLQKLSVEYVDVNSIVPNTYNPNRQSDHDFELLLKSIEEDGFTQPIICHQESREIVDGEHRWRAAKHLGYKEIPVVFVDMPAEQMRIATLRHNRARGSEDLELSAQVLRDLQELGAMDWAADSLMMSDAEINRLLDDIPAPEALADEDFNEAWLPDATGQKDDYSGDLQMAMTQKAREVAREREQKLKETRTQEERDMIRKEMDLYRLSLMYSGDEAVVVKAVCGKSPANRVLELCQAEYARRMNAEG